MKRLILYPMVLMSLAGTALAEGARTVSLDLAGTELVNHCTPEPVTVTDGIGRLVVRLDTGGDANGLHLLRRISAHGQAVGNLTGQVYQFSFSVPPAFLPSNNNLTNDHGTVNLIATIEMVNRDNPASGVSRLQIVIVTTLDFTTGGAAITRVLEVTRDCSGKP